MCTIVNLYYSSLLPRLGITLMEGFNGAAPPALRQGFGATLVAAGFPLSLMECSWGRSANQLTLYVLFNRPDNAL